VGTGDEGGQYDYRIFNTFNYFKGPLSATLRWRHYPSLEHSSIVQNPMTTTRGVDSYNIFDVNGVYSINETYAFRFGIDNLLDESPPIYGATPTSSAQGTTLAGYYDTLGRRMYVGFKAQF
jgi:outer membrane receptor for ferrienterochelin and colicin